MSWERSAYKEHYEKQATKFAKDTADYLTFMEARHKVVTIDYIATLENENSMLKFKIEYLEKKLGENKK